MKIETLLSQEDFFYESSFQKNLKEKFINIKFGFFNYNNLDKEQEFSINYQESDTKQVSQIVNKENITPQLQAQPSQVQKQNLSIIKEENQSNFIQSHQKIKNSTEIFKENFKQIYDQYDEEQEFLFSINESKEEKVNTQLSEQSIQKKDNDFDEINQIENYQETQNSWQQFQKQSDQNFNKVKITKIQSSEKNSLFIQDQQIDLENSIQNTLISNKSLDEENSFIQLEQQIKKKNNFQKQFTITEIQDEYTKNDSKIKPEQQDELPIKDLNENSQVNKSDCAIFEIIKNSLIQSKKQKIDIKDNDEKQIKNTQCYDIEKISINLDEDSIQEKVQTVQKQKTEISYKKTIQRLLEKGKQYKNTLRKKTQEKKQKEMQECSFTPKINQKKFNFKKQQQSSFILSSKHLDNLDKSKYSRNSQIRSTSNIIRNHNKKNFIKENIKKLKDQKYGTKSDIRQNKVKIIKFEQPSFKPKINRKSSIIASKRKKSITPLINKKVKSSSFIQKPQKFKASNKSEKIIQKKILNKFYSVLIQLQILQETENDYGDIPISKIQLFQICLQMKFFKISQKKFTKISLKKNQFFENIFQKKLISQDIYNLLTVMWDFLNENDQEIYIRDLAFFILAIYGIRVENDGECVFDQKTILKIQSSFKQFKTNSLRKEKIKSNKNLYSIQTQPIKSNKQKNSQLASNYRSKLLDKYTDYITQGLLPMPKKQFLDHADFLSLKEQIKEVELNQQRQLKKQHSLNECTFSPLVNSQISHKTLQPYRITEDFYESSKSVLKLEIKINGKNNETLFLCSEKDIQKEVERAEKKYNLKCKQVRKLQKVIQKQWKSYINDKQQFNYINL